MAHRLYSLLFISLILTMPLPVGAEAGPPLRIAQPPAPAAPSAIDTLAWYDGLIDYSTILNCASIIQGLPYQEYGAGTYVGFRADPNAGQPAINTTYYIHVVIAGLGNSCSGMRAYPDIALPASTSLAIDGGHPVYCYVNGVPISPSSACPQSLPPSSYHSGAYAIPSTDVAHGNTWPLPQGYTIEIQIPVRSSAPLSSNPLDANVLMLDGNSSPWLLARQGVYVFSNTPQAPAILYPSPSTITVTATSGHSEAYLYTYNATGTGYFDLGTTPSYGFIHEAVPILSASPAWVAWDDWGPPALTPDTLYHWRFTFTPSGGSTVYGTDQTFRTLPDGRVTVGQGQAFACTEGAFDGALSTAKEILFDCGPLPITVTLSSAKSIGSDLTINGGNKVTLKSNGTTNHFSVQGVAHLTLTKITLSDGINNSACGGAINVGPAAHLTLAETRFVDNRSDFYDGGAVCNSGTVDISNTLFKNNRSSYAMGGAIENYGPGMLSVTNSKFMSNTAGANGGSIDMGGTVTVTNGIFISNTAGFRGGGINTYYGRLSVTNSSFISNTANMYGGGLANDASTTTVSGSTFSDNYAASGGGLESLGSSDLTLTNSTVSANRALASGGGLLWYAPPGTGTITVLNSTIANNVAGTQGGNIYADVLWIPLNARIHIQNTLIAFGSPNNCDNKIASYGHNLENANSCGLVAAGDKINVNPKLGPLQNNGGLTLTRALMFGSPAIDAGSGCPATDQRGVARPIDGNRDGSAVCDIGAIEAPPRWPAFLPLIRK
jgi:hypothetical protein